MANKYQEQSMAAQTARKKHMACDRKVAFDTLGEAYQKGQRTYQCPYCNKWHRSGSFAKLVSRLKRK